MTTFEVVQSPNDSRKYRVIDLQNGLRAVLISEVEKPAPVAVAASFAANDALGNALPDEEQPSPSHESDAEEHSDARDSDFEDVVSSEEDGRRPNRDTGLNKLAAAGLCVAVGSFSDPPDIPGLAHFLEHMVFMGSEKYPNENSFDDYLTKHGGSSDAYTDCEQTVFTFDVEPRFFEGALDRFSQFFIHPLMKKESIDREIEAVDSEFEIGRPKDKHRLEQLLGNIAYQPHPMSKFMWGNAETLRTRPKLAGIDVYERLREFWKNHYVAQNMTLVVLSRDSLDQLEKLVRSIFSTIPSTSSLKPNFSDLGPPFSMATFNQVYRVVSMKKMHKVILTWSLPSQQSHYKVKPLHYVGYLLGHEGQGSIDSYLKKRHWAFELEAGNGDSGFDNNSSAALFCVSITLSEDGFKHVYEVITAVFEYLLMLQKSGPQLTLFNEIKTIEDNHFHWIEQTAPVEYVQDVCVAMQLYKPEDYLTGNTLLMEYNETLIKDCMDALTPTAVNIAMISHSFKDKEICNKECPWFKTRFGFEAIPDEWIQKWNALKTNPEFHLPSPNMYIATDFLLKPTIEPHSPVPVLISETPCSNLYYKKDDKFKVPKVYVHVFLQSDLVNLSPKSLAMVDLLVKLLEKSLTEVAYDANQADLSYAFKVVGGGITVKIGGYDEKIMQLFKVVFDHFVGLSFDEKQFESTRDEWKMIYHNQSLKASSLNKELRLSLLIHNYWTLMDKAGSVNFISYQDLTGFFKDLLSTITVKMLVHGNYTEQEAKALEDYLRQKLNFGDCRCVIAHTDLLVTELPDTAVCYRAKNLNNSDDNCVITNYYQHGPASIHEHQLMELLLSFMEEPCFDTLRTNRQLGYSVNCSTRLTHGIVGYSITICSQSSKFSMQMLDEEIERFLQKLRTKVERMSNQRFKRLVSSLVTLKKCEDANMQEEVERNWFEIVEGTCLFNRLQREVEELQQINVTEFKDWSSAHLLAGLKRRKYSIQVIGNNRVKDPKKVPSAPSVMKRPAGFSLESCKKHQRLAKSYSKKKSLLKLKDSDDPMPNKLKDDNGNVFIKDIAAYKMTCKVYPFSVVV